MTSNHSKILTNDSGTLIKLSYMRKGIIIYFILSNPHLLFSQSQSLKRDSSKTDQTPKVIVFNNVQGTPTQTQNPYDNLAKINLLSPLAGNLSINYEKKLRKKVSIEGGVGVTVKNYLTELFKFQNFGSSSDIVRTYLTGYSLSGALRYYPSGIEEGYYFAPEVRYRVYNSEVLSKGTNYPESTVLTDFKLTFGYVNFFEPNIFIEYFAGVGLRKKDITAYHETYSYNYSTGSSIASGLSTTSSIVPLIAGGLKLGFSF